MSRIHSTHKKALRALEPIANLLCQSHRHEMSIIDPASGKIVEGYSLTIECGGDSIIWTVKMGENCRFGSLMRAREGLARRSVPRTPQLHSIGRLKKSWLKYPMILRNDQHTSNINHLPSANGPQIGTGDTDPGHREPGGVVYVVCCPLSTGLSSDLFSEVSRPPSSPFDTEGEDADEYENRYDTESKSEGEDEESNTDGGEGPRDKGDEDEDEGDDQDWSEWEGPWRQRDHSSSLLR
ncbi:hypothetical protein B9Z19DRAFT_1135229 [Tuber borchii]|uniref:Uncharacterized protein n=1 Tax=Tuber borchii TaxID=42251 RepID=A0A2T6ZD13_TUBBO|nr:hypothetical protein B9Z19DRAFT_1135229 [Tuber borchii]